jgi:uncharacterized membrane protein affecting hemolysin expression
MLDETALETRLLIIEQTVAELQHRLEAQGQASVPQLVNNHPAKNWLDNLIGSISDEAAFLEAAAYGKAYRDSDRPVDEVL